MGFNGLTIVAIVQARMSSSRLPGKVLRELDGKPMLGWVVERIALSKFVDKIVVATTVDSSDDLIVQWCQDNNVSMYRGSMADVLDRFYQAARQFKADVVVRITADCPLIDPGEIDAVITEFFDKQVDFAANRLPPPFTRTFPIGLDTEVCSYAALERAWLEANQPYEREHVMPYLYSVPGRFKAIKLDYQEDLGSLRWTVDTAEDLEVIRAICAHFSPRLDFKWGEVLELVRANPEIMLANQQINHKTMLDVDQRYPGGNPE
jgi:spore coat polysaccharide biosynthesis protein SpsF